MGQLKDIMMRKTLFKLHAYGALIAMLPLFIISITGSILVFKVEIDSWLRPAHMLIQADAITPRASLDDLMQSVLSDNQGFELGGWEIFDDKQRSDTAYIIQRGTEDWFKVYVNQYENRVLSLRQSMEHYFTDWVLELHHSFLLHIKGASIALITAIVMLFLGVSGMILYRRFWAKLFTLRFRAVHRILFSDIHKFVGIISSPILIILAFTGAYWNFVGILHEINEHSDGEHVYITQPLHHPDISFEALRLQSQQEIASFKPGYLAMPHEASRDITFYGEVESPNPLNSEYASIVSYDKQTGQLLKKSDIREASALAVFVDSFRKLHFGYFAGIVSKVVWCLIGLMPLILGFTGGYLFYSRHRQRRIASRKRQQLRASTV